MTLRPLAALGCRLLAIYAVIQAAASLQPSFSFMATVLSSTGRALGMSISAWFYYLAHIIFMLVVAVLLWLGAESIAWQMVRSDRDLMISERVSWLGVRTFVVAMTGLWVLVGAVPVVVQSASAVLSFLYESTRATSTFNGGYTSLMFWQNGVAGTLNAAIRLGLGGYLLLNAAKIARRLPGGDDLPLAPEAGPTSDEPQPPHFAP